MLLLYSWLNLARQAKTRNKGLSSETRADKPRAGPVFAVAGLYFELCGENVGKLGTVAVPASHHLKDSADIDNDGRPKPNSPTLTLQEESS